MRKHEEHILVIWNFFSSLAKEKRDFPRFSQTFWVFPLWDTYLCLYLHKLHTWVYPSCILPFCKFNLQWPLLKIHIKYANICICKFLSKRKKENLIKKQSSAWPNFKIKCYMQVHSYHKPKLLALYHIATHAKCIFLLEMSAHKFRCST